MGGGDLRLCCWPAASAARYNRGHSTPPLVSAPAGDSLLPVPRIGPQTGRDIAALPDRGPSMKPEKVSVEDISAMRPVCLRRTIPAAYLDENNHMNMRWYGALFDDAGYTLHNHLGLTPEFHRAHGSGTMDLEHHTWFLNEVMLDNQVCV